MSNSSKAKAILQKVVKWTNVSTVISGLGIGGKALQVRTAEHPGGLWAVQTGSTILVDVSGSDRSEEMLSRLVKMRRSIAVRTAVVVALAILTLSMLARGADYAGLALVATLIAGIFLAGKVSAHEESLHYVVEISTDADSIRNGVEGAEAKEAAKAGAALAHALRQFTANEALLQAQPKRELIERVSYGLRQTLPTVEGATIVNATEDINNVLQNNRLN